MSKLILLRHGQSVWNKKNVFTGWVDVPLSAEGIAEATEAGKKIAAIAIDVIYTSVQIRALETAMIAMAQNKSDKTPVVIHTQGEMADRTKIYSDEMNKNLIPVYCDWHLNERHYGELQGKNKAETAKVYGAEQVHLWRRSFDVRPPEGECLEDTAKRTIPYFKEHVLKQLQAGKQVLISAHGNSLRSIVMFIEQLSVDEVINLEIPTGQPIFYDFDGEHLIRNL